MENILQKTEKKKNEDKKAKFGKFHLEETKELFLI